jgi:serine/threonine protein kinase
MYRSVVEPIPGTPIAPDKPVDASDLPGVEELTQHEPEMIRLFLNAHAQKLLASESMSAFAEYEKFLEEYDRAIHFAWYAKPKTGEDVVLGYRLTQLAEQGAFGKVYKALDSSGNTVAVKILREEVRENMDALVSFRRGIGSMRILQKHGIAGMVDYYDAAEIPAMVVMRWIDGDNLRRAIEKGAIHKWEDILRIGTELAEILHQAHRLPERVLHRDMRPANVMLEGLYGGSGWQVRVLDFDLSWHKGALEHTLVHTPGATGYLAPEQIHRVDGVSTRHSAVDSFGLGMTLYYMISGRDPEPNQQRHTKWEDEVREAATCFQDSEWVSLPSRLSRLIIAATRDAQAERPDMTAMHLELSRLYRLVQSDFKQVEGLDLLTEEIAARSRALDGFEWFESRGAAHVHRPSGVELDLAANESKGRITFSLAVPGRVDHGSRKTATKVAQSAQQTLKDAYWKVDLHYAEKHSFRVLAHIKAAQALSHIDKTAATIDKVLRAVGST